MANTAWIDLNSGEIDNQPSDPEMMAKYLGSRGYAARILYDHVGPEVDPLGPDNQLIFSAGPFTGSPWPTASRYTVTAKSPLTGAYGYANSAGKFGAQLKRSGYDALVFSGQAPGPTILVIDGEELRLEDGGPYWGKDTETTELALKEKHPGAKVAAIGPAGENLVRIAAVINDLGRAAGRCGMGAVMGSKKLKAIVVKKPGKVSYPAPFKALAGTMMKRVGTHPASKALRQWGTAFLVDPKNLSGDLPTRNHQDVQFAQGDEVNAESLGRYLEKNGGCFSCPIRCARYTRVQSGPYACRTEGPEYETINALGPMVGNADLASIIYGGQLCNRLGLDTISTGMVIAFAMECQQNGLLEGYDADLPWGDPDVIIDYIGKIAHRQGLGRLLGEGVRRAAAEIGPASEAFALHVKGMELPMQEPRTVKGMGLGHATSNRGADHLYALPCIDLAGNEEIAQKYLPGCLPEVLDTKDEKYKPDMVVFSEAVCAISDALGVCKFSTAETFAVLPEELAEGLSALYGQTIDGEELLQAGERIVNLERMYNHRQGLDRADDQLPQRFIKEGAEVKDLKSGEILQADLKVDLDYMLDRYYRLRGWDAQGNPTAEQLCRLQLEDLTPDLKT